jgi:hypothetical protein
MILKARVAGGTVVLVDSITQLDEGDAGLWAVSGSHGGLSSASFALALPLAGAVFNDAGIGKDEAGISALALLQAQGTPAVAVAHHSARIGDALDTWTHGLISRVNPAAAALGLLPGQRLQDGLRLCTAASPPGDPTCN